MFLLPAGIFFGSAFVIMAFMALNLMRDFFNASLSAGKGHPASLWLDNHKKTCTFLVFAALAAATYGVYVGLSVLLASFSLPLFIVGMVAGLGLAACCILIPVFYGFNKVLNPAYTILPPIKGSKSVDADDRESAYAASYHAHGRTRQPHEKRGSSSTSQPQNSHEKPKTSQEEQPGPSTRHYQKT
jgi:hypothetical protein